MKTPWPHQEDCVHALIDHYAGGHKRASFVMASGLGKTLTLGFFLQRFLRMIGRRMLFTVDQTTPLVQAYWSLRDLFCDQPYRFGLLTSDESHNVSNADFLFATLQSIRGRLTQFPRDHFSVMAGDEFHHAPADTYRRVVRYFNPRYLIGMTATPERGDGRTIEELFGPTIYNLPLPRALAQGKTARVHYRIVHANINQAALTQSVAAMNAGDRRVTTRAHVDRHILLPQDMDDIAAVVRETRAGGKKTVSFCASIDETKLWQPRFPEARQFHTGSNLSDGERKATFRMFKGHLLNHILVVDKFNEGVDVPSVGVLNFLRKTSQRRIWMQQLGRGLRDREKTVHVNDFVADSKRLLMVYDFMQEVIRHAEEDSDRLNLEMLAIGGGTQFSFSPELVDVLKLLNRGRIPLYPTMWEAALAVKGLGIKTQSQYLKRGIRQDPRLPTSPHLTYPEWKKCGAWDGLLGRIRWLDWERVYIDNPHFAPAKAKKKTGGDKHDPPKLPRWRTARRVPYPIRACVLWIWSLGETFSLNDRPIPRHYFGYGWDGPLRDCLSRLTSDKQCTKTGPLLRAWHRNGWTDSEYSWLQNPFELVSDADLAQWGIQRPPVTPSKL